VGSLAPVSADGTVMNKYFVTVFANNETKTFGAIEPFNDAFFAWCIG
tara:strand:- start:774 stop:914 length:141 start_codon:yes stop_codon:yes gene_type:complete